MEAECLKIRLNSAIDLLQMISEDIEDNFVGFRENRLVSSRGAVIVSSLSVVSAYLESICSEAAKNE